MFDERRIVKQIQQRSYPSNWRVYHGSGSYGCALMGWLFTICIIWWSSTMWSHMNTTLFLFFGIPCVVFIIVALSSWHKASSDASSVLVILPDGVVQCYAGKQENISCLYFSNIIRIELMQETEITGVDGNISTTTYHWFDVYGVDGTYMKWWIRSCFGDGASIGKTIIAAYNYYRRF